MLKTKYNGKYTTRLLASHVSMTADIHPNNFLYFVEYLRTALIAETKTAAKEMLNFSYTRTQLIVIHLRYKNCRVQVAPL